MELSTESIDEINRIRGTINAINRIDGTINAIDRISEPIRKLQPKTANERDRHKKESKRCECKC